jgi:hypothetical protein
VDLSSRGKLARCLRWLVGPARALGLLGLVSACATTTVVRSLKGSDHMGRVESARTTAEDSIEVVLSAALGGAYFDRNYELTLLRSELEEVSVVAAQQAADAAPELVLPRSRLKRCVGSQRSSEDAARIEIPILPSSPKWEAAVPGDAGLVIRYPATTLNPFSRGPLPVKFTVVWRDSGLDQHRCVTVGLEPDRSSTALAQWTAPLTLPVAYLIDACLILFVMAGAPH